MADHDDLLARLRRTGGDFYYLHLEAAAAIRELQGQLEAERKAREAAELRLHANQARSNELGKQLAAAERRLAEVERLLQQWLDHHTKAAGLTSAVAINREKFREFMDEIERKDHILIAATARALAKEPAAYSKSQYKRLVVQGAITNWRTTMTDHTELLKELDQHNGRPECHDAAAPVAKPEQEKPVAYIRATPDGEILWSDDCVCQDPVYPVDEFDTISEDSETQTISMPLYFAPVAKPDTVSVPLSAIDRMMRDCEHGSRIWKELDAIARGHRLAAAENEKK